MVLNPQLKIPSTGLEKIPLMLTEFGYIYTVLKLNLKYFILSLKLFPKPCLSLSRGLYTLQRNQSHVDE